MYVISLFRFVRVSSNLATTWTHNQERCEIDLGKLVAFTNVIDRAGLERPFHWMSILIWSFVSLSGHIAFEVMSHVAPSWPGEKLLPLCETIGYMSQSVLTCLPVLGVRARQARRGRPVIDRPGRGHLHRSISCSDPPQRKVACGCAAVVIAFTPSLPPLLISAKKLNTKLHSQADVLAWKAKSLGPGSLSFQSSFLSFSHLFLAIASVLVFGSTLPIFPSTRKGKNVRPVSMFRIRALQSYLGWACGASLTVGYPTWRCSCLASPGRHRSANIRCGNGVVVVDALRTKESNVLARSDPSQKYTCSSVRLRAQFSNVNSNPQSPSPPHLSRSAG